MAQRDYYWDCLKFILILLVVYGHVLNATTLPDDFSSGMARFIYLFHMPLFIYISGRFSHIRDRNKYKHGIWRLLETYILFMMLTTFLKFGLIPIVSLATHRASSISINWEEAIDYFIATPSYLWYLLTLVYYRLMVYFIPEGFVINKKRVLVISFIISLASGFVPVGYTLSIQRTLALLPFFVMGYYSVDFDVKERIGRVPIAIAWGGVFSFLLVCYFLRGVDIGMLTNAMPYWDGHLESFGHSYRLIIARYLYTPSAILLGAIIMRLTPTRVTLARWGSHTMFIFIYHMFAITPLAFLLNGSGVIPQFALALFVYAVIITILFLFLSRIKFLNYMLNPISNISLSHAHF